MPEKSIAIIGAGVAGLAAGCYGRMNGYDTHIFEMQAGPGGLCTSWERGGYTFDGCLHWLVGSREGPLYELWRGVGALEGAEVVDFEPFFAYEAADGRTVTFYNDPDRLQEHLLELAPEDAATIKKLTQVVRDAASPDAAASKEVVNTWGGVSLRDFGAQLRNPLLAEAIAYVLRREVSVFHFLTTLAFMWRRNAGYPVGGSLAFSKRIEKRYLDLGGDVTYGARVEKILVEGDRAVGVRLEDGTEHRADYVVSAADGRTAIFDMLEGRYVDDKVRGYYDELPLFKPLLYLSFGVADALADAPHYLTFNFASLPRIAGEEVRRASFRVFNFDATLAPPGKTVVTVMFGSNYDYWKKLRDKDLGRYEAQKGRVAAAVLDDLERRFPGIKNKVEVCDVATPATFERLTGNWKGSFAGWEIPPPAPAPRMEKALPGLANFWMAGQWVMPGGGLPSALISGRQVIQLICSEEGKEFTTNQSAA
jgi:phytoene dehydrogenase-like protein